MVVASDGEGKHKHRKPKIRRTAVAQQAGEVVGWLVEITQKKRRGKWATVAWPLDEARCRDFICRPRQYQTSILHVEVSRTGGIKYKRLLLATGHTASYARKSGL